MWPFGLLTYLGLMECNLLILGVPLLSAILVLSNFCLFLADTVEKALRRAFIILYNFPTSKLTRLSKWQPPKSYSMIFVYLIFYLFIILTITHQEIPIELQGSWQFAYLVSGFI